MPVETCHTDYLTSCDQWKRVRDCLEGWDALVASNVYVPALYGQEEKDYKAYKRRGCYLPMPEAFLEMTLGIILRTEPATEGDKIPEDWLKNFDLQGGSLTDYRAASLREVASIGRAGTLVDWSEELARPYAAFYKAEDVINWKEEVVRGVPTLTLLVLRSSCCEECPDDRFLHQAKDEYLVYELVRTIMVPQSEAGADIPEEFKPMVEGAPVLVPMELETPIVVAKRYRQSADSGQWIVVEEASMTRRGTSIDRIPWVWHSSQRRIQCCPAKPPLLPMCDVSISHFNNSVDAENGRHMCGCATPWAVGFGEKFLTLGASHAWTTDNVEAKAGFLEPTGQGIGTLEKAMEEKQRMMAMLGARLLDAKQGQAEAAEAIAMRNEAQTSQLRRYADNESSSYTRILSLFLWWAGTETPNLTYKYGTDFGNYTLTPALLNSLTNAYLSQSLSFHAYWNKLSQLAAYPPDWTADEELNAIRSAPPPGATPFEPDKDDARTE